MIVHPNILIKTKGFFVAGTFIPDFEPITIVINAIIDNDSTIALAA